MSLTIGGTLMSSDLASKKARTVTSLQEEVEKLTALTVPMHMPGHKRAPMPSDALPTTPAGS